MPDPVRGDLASPIPSSPDLKRRVDCEACQGLGVVTPDPLYPEVTDLCPACMGAGTVDEGIQYPQEKDDA